MYLNTFFVLYICEAFAYVSVFVDTLSVCFVVEGLHFHPTNVPGGARAQESNLRQGRREADTIRSCHSLAKDTAYMQQARQEP